MTIKVKTLNDYQELTRRTAPTGVTIKEALSNFGLGIAGEGGEVADEIKKVLHHGHALNELKLAKEIGDVLWYAARLAETIGFSLQEIAEMNVNKLAERYPEGFQADRSINRIEE